MRRRAARVRLKVDVAAACLGSTNVGGTASAAQLAGVNSGSAMDGGATNAVDLGADATGVVVVVAVAVADEDDDVDATGEEVVAVADEDDDVDAELDAATEVLWMAPYTRLAYSFRKALMWLLSFGVTRVNGTETPS